MRGIRVGRNERARHNNREVHLARGERAGPIRDHDVDEKTFAGGEQRRDAGAAHGPEQRTRGERHGDAQKSERARRVV
jgi:hypothetical protein